MVERIKQLIKYRLPILHSLGFKRPILQGTEPFFKQVDTLKVIIHKSHGAVSLVEQDTTENVS